MQFYTSPAAAAAKLPFSQAVRVGDVLYLSGALGNLPGKRELVAGGIAMLLYMAVSAAMHTILMTAVYQYAAHERIPEGFERQAISRAFAK